MKKFILLILILFFSIGFIKLKNHYKQLDRDLVHESVNSTPEEPEVLETTSPPEVQRPVPTPDPIPEVVAPTPNKITPPAPKSNYEKPVAPDAPSDPTPSPQVSYDSNTLVSCSTLRKNCEPYNLGENENGDVETFCISYAANCTNPSSIQRTWRHDEVFRPEPEPAAIPEAPMDNYEAPELPPETPPYVPDPYNNGNGDY